MMNLIAKGRLPYGTRVLKDGEPLRVSTQDGRLLVALGRAKVAPEAEGQEQQEQEQEHQPDEPASAEAAEKAKKPKRKYTRRDMTAE